MNVRGRHAIDCDVHANVPAIQALVPYLDDYWQDMVEVRGIEGFESRSYPPQAPLSCRPDWRTPAGRPAEDLAMLRTQVLDRWQTKIAILNCLYGVQLIMDEHMAAAFAGAVNEWLVKEWLDRRAAPSGLDRGRPPEPGARGRGDRASGGRPALRPGAAARDRRDAARAQRLTGRSTRPPSATTCRSGSTPAAAIATRSPRSAGRPTTSRTTWRRPRASRRSSRA